MRCDWCGDMSPMANTPHDPVADLLRFTEACVELLDEFARGIRGNAAPGKQRLRELKTRLKRKGLI